MQFFQLVPFPYESILKYIQITVLQPTVSTARIFLSQKDFDIRGIKKVMTEFTDKIVWRIK